MTSCDRCGGRRPGVYERIEVELYGPDMAKVGTREVLLCPKCAVEVERDAQVDQARPVDGWAAFREPAFDGIVELITGEPPSRPEPPATRRRTPAEVWIASLLERGELPEDWRPGATYTAIESRPRVFRVNGQAIGDVPAWGGRG